MCLWPSGWCHKETVWQRFCRTFGWTFWCDLPPNPCFGDTFLGGGWGGVRSIRVRKLVSPAKVEGLMSHWLWAFQVALECRPLCSRAVCHGSRFVTNRSNKKLAQPISRITPTSELILFLWPPPQDRLRLFYWVMTGNPLELFRKFFGAVSAMFFGFVGPFWLLKKVQPKAKKLQL